MKKILIGVFAAVAMVSCKTDRADHPHIDPQAAKVASVTPISPISQLELKKNMANAKVVFNWSAADYGFDAAVKYVLQADIKGGDFSSPVELASVDGISAQMTVDKLNGILVGKFKFDPAGVDDPAKVYQFDVRVGSRISDYIDRIYSAPYTINVITYQDKIIVPSLGVPGSYQGWAPENPDTRLWSVLMNKIYTGWLNMVPTDGSDPKFKFVDGIDWATGDNIYGNGVGLKGSIEAGIDTKDNEGVPAGYYKVEVDLNTLTYELTPITTWGLIGNATPGAWDTSTPMTYDALDHVWIVKDVVCSEGEFKFRANNGWDINFGATTTDPEFLTDGKLSVGGANIKITAGKYTFKMDLSQSTPNFEIIPQ